MPKDGQIAARLVNGFFALEFRWEGDRFVHMVSSKDGSLEASEHPSLETPVYQEVHQQDDIIFASGMSNDRHWSASIQASASGFNVDVACRAKSGAGQLGVAYQGHGTLTLEPSDNTTRFPLDRPLQALRSNAAKDVPPYTVRMQYGVVSGW